ncbi:MAG: formate/nitrite transporter family protein [Verrucomicrobiales bacterium]|nr:formate/nitrite transporter family protein [Verrucomicrobiales bacterium]
MAELYGSDAFSPDEIAAKVESIGVKKAGLSFIPMFALAVLAGGFIGLGALYYLLIVSDPEISFGIERLLGGLVFSLGLILVIVAGAELFTGNNLMVMAWVSGKIPLTRLLRNFGIVYLGNAVGAIGLALLVYLSGHLDMNNSLIGRTADEIAAAKLAMPLPVAFFKGVLCNILVCLAVWLAMAGRSVTDKILAVVFPISAFVAAGFEHCIANLYFVPLGIFNGAKLSWSDFILDNLIPVTFGNLLGGAGMVGFVYWIIYRRNQNN